MSTEEGSSEKDAALGLGIDAVSLAPHNPDWLAIFQKEKDSLSKLFLEVTTDIQHVGSTSIPGIVSKPILDIALGVQSFEELDTLISLLTEQGYDYRGECGVVDRHFFRDGDPTTIHIHLVKKGSRQWEDLILFRDYLLRYPEAAKEYEVTKKKLREEFRDNRKGYTAAKEPIIQAILAKARSAS